jgi:hypothetical protein
MEAKERDLQGLMHNAACVPLHPIVIPREPMCSRAAVEKKDEEEEFKAVANEALFKSIRFNVDAEHDRACGLPGLRIEFPPPTRVDGIQNQYPLENLGGGRGGKAIHPHTHTQVGLFCF